MREKKLRSPCPRGHFYAATIGFEIVPMFSISHSCIRITYQCSLHSSQINLESILPAYDHIASFQPYGRFAEAAHAGWGPGEDQVTRLESHEPRQPCNAESRVKNKFTCVSILRATKSHTNRVRSISSAKICADTKTAHLKGDTVDTALNSQVIGV